MVQYLMAHYMDILGLVVAIFATGGLAELATRLTKTKTDDGFVKRIGSAVDKLSDLLGLPNKRK